ncbi:GNAT family N-acetyltransferase [Ferruginibacter albus]|uniref:GNAT family N-acetyltransferase n=1 Tax=Ferruginibacter albus TaxID=2875540 RepID=UPI001CC6C257|nr:GNAT family N-acetyltransferase [Ferruginibacter albus]UAY51175.1 GNAT family N-acetyltransferase [Ferruginibacter albus]
MEIRRISIAESNLVIELFNQYRIFYKQASNIELAKQFIEERLNNNESVIFLALVIENNKTIPAGFTQLYPTYSSVRTSKNWILNDLYVKSAYRKQGVGELLIKTAMDFAKAGGAKFVELSTATDNYTAQSLYKKIGFEKQKPDDEFYSYRITL